MSIFSTLTLTRNAHTATVTLNRPEVRNAFNALAIAELTEVFDTLGQDASVRAIVLRANGSAFCAGADLQWMRQMAGFSNAENLADATLLARMLCAIYRCPKPVVACVQGDCYAGGMGLVAACDIAVVADQVQFCLSEVRLGLIPATISPYVIRAMGENAARRYFLTAERFEAHEALRIGFVHKVVATAELDGAVSEVVDAMCKASPHAVREAKRLVREIAGAVPNESVIADTAHRIAEIRASAEGREGVQAFLDKRKPGWLV